MTQRTRCGSVRRDQMRGRWPQSLPGMAARSGWRRGRRRFDSDGDDDMDLLRVWTRGGHQSELQREGNKPVQERGRGGVGTHRILRSCPQRWRTPACNFVALVAFQMQERDGNGRGEGGG
jgi:hypothetical protein